MRSRLSLLLAAPLFNAASLPLRPDRTSLGAAEPRLQHQPDHRRPGVEPAGRHGRTQRRHLQGHLPALQLGARGVRGVRAQRGILAPAVGISGHVRDRGGPARPRQLHVRGGGGERRVRPEPHAEAVRGRQHLHRPSR